MAGARSSTLQLTAAAAATLVLGTLVRAHVDGVNGPAYWPWAWQQIEVGRLLPPFIVALVPFGVAQWLHEKRRLQPAIPLALMMTSSLLLQAVSQGLQSEPFSLARIASVIESPGANGYLQAASRILEEPEALRCYPEILPTLPMHPQTKPPGVALTFAVFISGFGGGVATAMVIAIWLAALATLAIPATYAVVRGFCGGEVAFAAASLIALLPATGAFSPSFDAVYPVLSCAWVATWHRALNGQLGAAIAFGTLVAVGAFYSYSLLLLGFFLMGMTLCWAAPRWRMRVPRAALQAGIALAACGACYALLFALTGFDPFATFAAAVRNQEAWLEVIPRPYPQTVLFDLTDFLMGAGWIPLIPAMAGLCLGIRARDRDRVSLVAVAFLQFLVVAASGLLPGETMRVWLFLQPLLAMCAATEVGRWPVLPRLVFFACTAALYAVIVQNMIFVVP